MSVLQVVVGFGWGAVLSFAAVAMAVKIWMLLAAMPFLLTSILLVETICTAQLTKVPTPIASIRAYVLTVPEHLACLPVLPECIRCMHLGPYAGYVA